MNKHSQGPWEYRGHDFPIVSSSDGIWICDMEIGDVRAQERIDADARLIAAAPEMLELLRENPQEWCPPSVYILCGRCWMCRKRALLARIDGDG